VLTPRFFILALGIPILLLMGNWLSILVPVALLMGIGLIGMLLLDRHYAGTVDQFRIERHHDQKLSLGAQNRIALRITSRARRPIELTVRDEPPLMFVGAMEAIQTQTLPPLDTTELTYHVRPLRRGDYRFGDINLRWDSPMGFYIRQAVIPASAPVKVYPNLREIQKYELLARRDQVAEMGFHSVRQRGEGTAFESLRDYRQGDPYRGINWKATARRGKPISTDYEPERSQRVLIALDVGRMMRSPIRVDDPDGASWNMAKVDFVINSVLLFSHVATTKGDQIGLLVFADRIQQYIAPRAGHAHFHKLLEAMYGLESQPVEADYGRALNYLHVHNQKRSLVVLFTDLSGLRASEALIKYMPRLAPRHLPLLVITRDPALDQEAEQTPTNSDAVYRRVVAGQIMQERRLLLEKLQRHGVMTIDVDAEHLTMAVVNRYLELKVHQLA
jgi:uncharacterized protein (DUF58 family)